MGIDPAELVGWISGRSFLAIAVDDPLTGLIAAATAVEPLNDGRRRLTDVALSRVARAAPGPFAGPTDAARGDRGTDPTAVPMPLDRDTDQVPESLGVA